MNQERAPVPMDCSIAQTLATSRRLFPLLGSMMEFAVCFILAFLKI